MRVLFKILTLICIFLGVTSTVFALDKNSAALKQKGIEAYNNGNYQSALYYLTSIPKNDHTLEIVLCIANSYESLGDIRAAVVLLESLNRHNMDNYSAFYNLGNIYLKAKIHKNAIAAYKICNRLNNRFAPAFYNLGIAYYEIKDYHKALFNFEKAIRLNPSNKDYIYNAAICLELIGDKKVNIPIIDLIYDIIYNEVDPKQLATFLIEKK